MIVRAEENAVLLWNPRFGKTAYINGKELNVLYQWAINAPNNNASPTPFIQKLQKLALLPDNTAELQAVIEQSQAQTSPAHALVAPESLHIELTSSCPLSCPQCYKALDEHLLPFDVLKSYIIQAGQMKVFQLAFGGGEPLLYPHLTEAITLAHSFKMATSITTSGYQLNQEKLHQLMHAGLNHIQISLNGSTAEIHHQSRDGFAIGIQALQVLKETTVSYGINWVARKDNWQDFEQLVQLAKKYQCDNVNILRYKPSQKEKYEDQCLNPEETRQLANRIASVQGIKINLDSAYSNLLCYLNQGTGFLTGCGAGRRFMAINADGELMPCSHINMRAKTSDLKTFWAQSELLAVFRNLEQTTKAPCQNCSYLSGCRGCRAITQYMGDFDDGDCHCFLRTV